MGFKPNAAASDRRALLYVCLALAIVIMANVVTFFPSLLD